MAKIAGRTADYTLNSVSIEEYLDSITLNLKQDTPISTAFADAGPRRVTGGYDWDISIGGPNDYAASLVDATLFAALGAERTSAFDPTGATAAANDPNYDGSVVLSSYSITAGIGDAQKFSASLLGSTALTRAVA